jgi:hypothetical protein
MVVATQSCHIVFLSAGSVTRGMQYGDRWARRGVLRVLHLFATGD